MIKLYLNINTTNLRLYATYYHGKCPAVNCVDDYIGETARRVNKRIVDNAGRDSNSHLLKHSIESGHKTLEAVDYKIIGT